MAIEQKAIGLFSSYQSAESALRKLKDAGFNMAKVSVVAKDDEGNIEGAKINSEENPAAGTAKTGATVGGIGGGTVGLVGSLGVLAIPGVGPIAELGVLLANTLFAGAIGAAGGGLVGALVGWGLSRDQADYYNNRVYHEGDYLVLVEGSISDIRTAEAIFKENHISDWHAFSSTDETIAPSATSTDTTEDIHRQQVAHRKLRRLRNRQPV